MALEIVIVGKLAKVSVAGVELDVKSGNVMDSTKKITVTGSLSRGKQRLRGGTQNYHGDAECNYLGDKAPTIKSGDIVQVDFVVESGKTVSCQAFIEQIKDAWQTEDAYNWSFTWDSTYEGAITGVFVPPTGP